MQEAWVRSLGWEDTLEDIMTKHSSVLFPENPKDREPWWALWSTGSQRVGQDWATKHSVIFTSVIIFFIFDWFFFFLFFLAHLCKIFIHFPTGRLKSFACQLLLFGASLLSLVFCLSTGGTSQFLICQWSPLHCKCSSHITFIDFRNPAVFCKDFQFSCYNRFPSFWIVL